MTEKKVIAAACIALLFSLVLSACSSSANDNNDEPPYSSSSKIQTSSGSSCGNCLIYDGKTYRTTLMPDGKTWMAENLNYPASGSYCYNDDNNYCSQYGRLYNFNTAISVCPSGWHLPTKAEWDNLVTLLGGTSQAGRKLKSVEANGLDDYDFSGLLSGVRNAVSGFEDLGTYGYWWSGTKSYRVMINGSNSEVNIGDRNSGHMYSVRCVKD